jgi:hypothetical protein
MLKKSYSLFFNVKQVLGYLTILDVSFENIALGNPVVVTAPFIKDFYDSTWINDMHQRVKSLNGELVLLWVRTDLDVLKKRMALRGEPRDKWKLDHWKEYVSSLPISLSNDLTVTIVENSTMGETELYKSVRSMPRLNLE